MSCGQILELLVSAMVAREINVLSDDDVTVEEPAPKRSAAKSKPKASETEPKSKPAAKPKASETEPKSKPAAKPKASREKEPKPKPAAKPKASEKEPKSKPAVKPKASGKQTPKKDADSEKENKEGAEAPQKKPAALKRPAAAGASSAGAAGSEHVRKATKYCYHKEHKWGVKLNGKEQCTVRPLVEIVGCCCCCDGGSMVGVVSLSISCRADSIAF